jgi:hypothetical protein
MLVVHDLMLLLSSTDIIIEFKERRPADVSLQLLLEDRQLIWSRKESANAEFTAKDKDTILWKASDIPEDIKCAASPLPVGFNYSEMENSAGTFGLTTLNTVSSKSLFGLGEPLEPLKKVSD